LNLKKFESLNLTFLKKELKFYKKRGNMPLTSKYLNNVEIIPKDKIPSPEREGGWRAMLRKLSEDQAAKITVETHEEARNAVASLKVCSKRLGISVKWQIKKQDGKFLVFFWNV